MKMDRDPTLQTIADIAGLSRSTVSRALRNDPMQSRKTCEKVQQIAEEIGYRPSPMVSALMTQLKRGRKSQRTATIGLIDLFDEKERAKIVSKIQKAVPWENEFIVRKVMSGLMN